MQRFYVEEITPLFDGEMMKNRFDIRFIDNVHMLMVKNELEHYTIGVHCSDIDVKRCGE